MDPLISKLNQAVAAQIETPKGFSQAPQTSSSFQATLDSKLTDKLMDTLMDGARDTKPMQVLSADNIHIETQAGDSIRSTKIGSSDQVFDMFKSVNKDMLSIDTAIETLTSGIKLNPQQLLALQAGVSNVSIMAEAFSKVTGSLAQGINSIVQTQV